MFDLKTVTKRLKSLGYEVEATDEIVLTFCIEKVGNTIRNETNQKEVPRGLEQIATDMAVGEFLLSKVTFSPDTLDIDLDYAVKQIQEGDTNFSFAVGEGSFTPEQRLNSFINYLTNCGKSQYSAYRRLRW